MSVRSLTLAAMLTAMSVVIGIFCKSFMNYGNGLFRVTFENLPIIMSGMFFGPIIGAVVGASTDLISYLLSPQTYPPNLVVTLGATCVGAVSGIVSRFIIKKSGYIQIIVSGAAAHIIGSMIIKPIGLFAFYQWAVLWRIPLYLVMMPIEITVICFLYKNKNFRILFDGVKKNNTKSDLSRKMRYSEALDYIHSVSWLGSRPGLSRITELCHAMGDPQKGMKFVHVTGTNGKGSTCAMTESILRHAGYRTGLFTSPYVRDFCERIMIDGKPVSHEVLAGATEYVKGFAEKMQDKPTEFELITAIAFKIFRDLGCDITVLEAGMGGRLDSTNVIDAPVLAVITGVSLDHTAILGDTVAKIAKEKAGIIKSQSEVLYCGKDVPFDKNADFESSEIDLNDENTSAYDVIKREADRVGVPLNCCDHQYLKIKKADLNGMIFDYCCEEDLQIPLLGLYQGENSVRVLKIVELLRKKGFEIPESAVREGLKTVVWHARFEKLFEDPIVLYDGGHNPEGISAAVEAISYYFPNQKINLLTGVMADKDYRMMASELSPLVNKVFAVTPNNPRALDAAELAEVYRRLGIEAKAFSLLSEGCLSAFEESKNSGTPLICLGSLYMYGEVCEAYSI